MKHTILITLTALLTPAAAAQTVYFEDSFDTGLGNWTVSSSDPASDGAWHWMSAADPCAPAFTVGAGAARMGDPDCTFTSVGSHRQMMELSTPVYIPLLADAPELSFSSYARTEGCFHWDYHYTQVRRAGETTWSTTWGPCGQGQLGTSTLSLDEYRGDAIHIRFLFDPIDASGNETFGWLIDNVRITAAQCSATNYCTATPNSGSPTGARMGYSGSGRIHLNSFVLEASDGPPNEFLLFFCGPDRIQTPLGDGSLCVGPGASGIMRLPVQRFDATGHTLYAFDFESPLVAAGEFLPGSNWQFQCWFRDGGGPAGSNLSDALSVTFCP